MVVCPTGRGSALYWAPPVKATVINTEHGGLCRLVLRPPPLFYSLVCILHRSRSLVPSSAHNNKNRTMKRPRNEAIEAQEECKKKGGVAHSSLNTNGGQCVHVQPNYVFMWTYCSVPRWPVVVTVSQASSAPPWSWAAEFPPQSWQETPPFVRPADLSTTHPGSSQ